MSQRIAVYLHRAQSKCDYDLAWQEENSGQDHYKIPLILYKRVAAINQELRKSGFVGFCSRSSASEPEHTLTEQESLRNWYMVTLYGNIVNQKCVLPNLI